MRRAQIGRLLHWVWLAVLLVAVGLYIASALGVEVPAAPAIARSSP
jgi:hypothetical protein